MLHRLVLKVTKFQLPPPKLLSIVVKNIFLGGGMMTPMSNRVNSNVSLFGIRWGGGEVGGGRLPFAALSDAPVTFVFA